MVNQMNLKVSRDKVSYSFVKKLPNYFFAFFRDAQLVVWLQKSFYSSCGDQSLIECLDLLWVSVDRMHTHSHDLSTNLSIFSHFLKY